MNDSNAIFLYGGLIWLSTVAAGAVVGFLWGHYVGRLEGPNVVRRVEGKHAP